VLDVVDKVYVFYAPAPSLGQSTDLPIPDSESGDKLAAIAQEAAGDKLRWVEGTWNNRGDHRTQVFKYEKDADCIIDLDYDEIWNDPARSIELGFETGVRNVTHNMIHYWRSFTKAILHDPAFPRRLYYPKAETADAQVTACPINHMGYAIPVDLCKYKIDIHGHKNEFNDHWGWLENVYIANRQTDCHIVGSQWWNTQTIAPLEYLPAFMSEHPYYGLEVIE
jgi:hypothetical protein